VLGIALMVLEAFTPSFGTLGLGGIVAFTVGSLFLFDPSQSDVHFAVAWPLIAGATAASVLFLVGILGFALKARRNPVRTGAEEMIGSLGEVVSWEQGQGNIHTHGEVWAATSDQALAIGQKVRVAERVGLTLIVEAIK
jgi:membrane-bound serine protease (ClpP class)